MIEITALMVEESKGKYGFTRPQERLGITIFGHSWKTKMKGRIIDQDSWSRFCRLGYLGAPLEKPKKKVKKRLKNKKNRGRNKAKREKLQISSYKEFYESREWRELRVKVLEKYECKCMMCGRSPKHHGIVIHADHIKPRSKYPELELDFDNLQLLCEDCNLGKLNKYKTDWRPKLSSEELDIIYDANERI